MREIHFPVYPYVLSSAVVADLQCVEIKHLIYQIFHIINTIHETGIIHCDIKPNNILLKNDSRPSDFRRYNVIIIDFNMSKLDTEVHQFNSVCSSKHFRAPEILYNETTEIECRQYYTNAVDVWSIGCTLFYMLYRRFITVNEQEFETYKKNKLSFYREKNEKNAEFLDLISDCLIFDYKNRPSCATLIERYKMRENWDLNFVEPQNNDVQYSKWVLPINSSINENKTLFEKIQNTVTLTDVEMTIFIYLYSDFLAKSIEKPIDRANLAMNMLTSMYSVRIKY